MNRTCPHCNVEIPEGEEAAIVTVQAGDESVDRVLCDEALDELATAMLKSGRATITLDDSEDAPHTMDNTWVCCHTANDPRPITGDHAPDCKHASYFDNGGE